MSMPWLPSLDTGVGGFDDDHRHIFEVLEEMRDSLSSGNLSGVRALFEELSTSTLEHFREEEASMELYRYPEAAAHRAEHDRCRDALETLQRVMAGGHMARLADLLADYTAAYFRAVLRHDGELARFLRQVGPSSPCSPCRPQPPLYGHHSPA